MSMSQAQSGSDRQHHSWTVLWAVNMAAAVVARADGAIYPAERDRLGAYLQSCGLDARASPIGRGLFDKCIRELEREPVNDQSMLSRVLAGFDETPWARIILRAATHVAAADEYRGSRGGAGDRNHSHHSPPAVRGTGTLRRPPPLARPRMTTRHSDPLHRLGRRLPGPARSALTWVLRPEARWLRIPLALLLIFGGFLGFLPDPRLLDASARRAAARGGFPAGAQAHTPRDRIGRKLVGATAQSDARKATDP